jgi:hypothetical protein
MGVEEKETGEGVEGVVQVLAVEEGEGREGEGEEKVAPCDHGKQILGANSCCISRQENSHVVAEVRI